MGVESISRDVESVDIGENIHDNIIVQRNAPGTVLLEDLTQVRVVAHGADGTVVLQPQPSRDPNDPLNWSLRRKLLNFGLVSFYNLWIFVELDIGTVAWASWVKEWGVNYGQLDDAYAACLAGLAAGSLLFLPFALKFGRRPVYLLSTFIVFLVAIWQSLMSSFSGLVATQVLSGLAGGVSEIILTMTIGDIWFTHQRGKASAFALFMVEVGSFLGPVASGYIVRSQGWRWMYWWCTIFLGITTLAFLFFYEETKFVPTATSVTPRQREFSDQVGSEAPKDVSTIQTTQYGIDDSIPLKTYRQRLPFYTNTPGGWGKLVRHMFQPILLLGMFPAVAFVALNWGAALTWFAIVSTSQATYFVGAPYHFGSIGIGLLKLPPFIGTCFGCFWSGPISDWAIVYFAKRNKGVFEPEMRLYLLVAPALIGPIGLFTYGYSLDKGMHWIIPAVGTALYGFGVSGICGTSTTFMLDSYKEIVGDSLVAVAVVRNALSMMVTFIITPWFSQMAFRDCWTLIGCLALGLNLLFIPMIIFGKRFRIACAANYEKMIGLQFDARKHAL